jgi:2,4-dienoyl-CoA reductase-like NADH-dependent reductase (Old Yellow Enzyme family)
MSSILFSPFRLRELTLPNRIVVSPMAQYSAREGLASDWHRMHLGHMSVSGAALLIIEATSVTRSARLSPGDLGLWSDAHAEALAPIVDFCRAHGSARLGIQLQHAGRKASVTVAWEHQREIGLDDGGWTIRGPDAIAYPARTTPLPLTTAEIAEVVAEFANAARRADALGLDVVEIHAAHGYLLHNFLSPLSNQRDDEYGGSLTNRMRFVLEVFTAVRAAFAQHKPVGVRISATDWTPGGWEVEDSLALAAELKARGCDYVTASSGGTVPEQSIPIAPGYQVPFAERIKREVGIATMAVGLITEPRQAEAIVGEGKADLCALGRGMLYNPRWPWHAAAVLGAEATFPVQYQRAHPSMRKGNFLRPSRGAETSAGVKANCI